LLRFLGLSPCLVGEHRWGERSCAVVAADWRGHSIAAALHRASSAAPALDAPAMRTVRVAVAPLPVMASPPAPPAPPDPRVDPAPSDQPRGAPTGEARDLSAALERRVAQIARSAALSPREHEVLQLLLLGRNYAEIGVALQITPRTARFHQHNVLEKIGAESRLDIIRLLL
jgi:DNA-binding CsgD family transcriptional regulator